MSISSASPAQGLTQQPTREPGAQPRLGAEARGQGRQRGRGWCWRGTVQMAVAAPALQHPTGTAQGAGRTTGTRTPCRDSHNCGCTLVTVTLNFSALCFPKQPGCEHTQLQDGILYSHEQTLARPACRSCSQLLDGANKGGFLHRLASKPPAPSDPADKCRQFGFVWARARRGRGGCRAGRAGSRAPAPQPVQQPQSLPAAPLTTAHVSRAGLWFACEHGSTQQWRRIGATGSLLSPAG